jgi:hypothetical protein
VPIPNDQGVRSWEGSNPLTKTPYSRKRPLSADNNLMSATVSFFKKPTLWRDRRARYNMVIDGSSHGPLVTGQPVTILVSPGPHWAQLKCWWTSSPKAVFCVADGDAITFECGPIGNAFTAIFQGIFEPHRCMYLKKAATAEP